MTGHVDGNNRSKIVLDGWRQQQDYSSRWMVAAAAEFFSMATVVVGFYSKAYSSYKVEAHRMHMPRRLSTFFLWYRQ